MNEEFLNRLLKSISVSGYEEPVQEAVKMEMKEYTDEIREDEMHNLVCVINPEHPVRIMLSAHADEIGLMISNITEEGTLQVIDRGGIVTHTAGDCTFPKGRCLRCGRGVPGSFEKKRSEHKRLRD